MPGRLPLLGHGIRLIRAPVDFVTSLREYGDVVRLHLGPAPVLFVTDAALVHQMLTTDSAKYTRGKVFDKARRFFGESVAILSGPEHRVKRRMLQPAFAKNHMASYVDPIREAVEQKTTSWAPGQRIAVEKQMHELSAAMLVRSFFGTRLTDAEVLEICRCADVVMRGALVRTVLPAAFESLPIPANRRFSLAVHRLQAIVGRLIDTCRADDGDLLSLLLASGTMTDRQIYDEIITIVVGGLGNTAAALAWTFHELARNPDAEARLHAEVDAAGPDDLGALTFTARCVEEAVRPRGVWFLLRRALVDTELGGTAVPAGTEVMYSLTALHRDPAVYPDPTRFDPDRPVSSLPRHAYFPFGAGPHKCIGEHFGTTATTLAVAAIARRWRLKAVAGKRVREVVDATVRPASLPMILAER